MTRSDEVTDEEFEARLKRVVQISKNNQDVFIDVLNDLCRRVSALEKAHEE